MSALKSGSKAPDIKIPLVGGGTFSLSTALSQGRVALAFFKVSCPVCQYAFPYFERFSQKLKAKGLTFVGVSQDNERDTTEFTKMFGVTFPVALDRPDRYQVSSDYGLTNVPTLFVINGEGLIDQSIVGWSKSEMEILYKELGDSAAVIPIFAPGEKVADFKPG